MVLTCGEALKRDSGLRHLFPAAVRGGPGSRVRQTLPACCRQVTLETGSRAATSRAGGGLSSEDMEPVALWLDTGGDSLVLDGGARVFTPTPGLGRRTVQSGGHASRGAVGDTGSRSVWCNFPP